MMYWLLKTFKFKLLNRWAHHSVDLNFEGWPKLFADSLGRWADANDFSRLSEIELSFFLPPYLQYQAYQNLQCYHHHNGEINLSLGFYIFFGNLPRMSWTFLSKVEKHSRNRFVLQTRSWYWARVGSFWFYHGHSNRFFTYTHGERPFASTKVTLSEHVW